MIQRCERCQKRRHNVSDPDNAICHECQGKERKAREGYKPRPWPQADGACMVRTGTSNVWTKLSNESVAWLKTEGPKLRADGVNYCHIRDDMATMFGVKVSTTHVINILAGRAWGWMENPEEVLSEWRERESLKGNGGRGGARSGARGHLA